MKKSPLIGVSISHVTSFSCSQLPKQLYPRLVTDLGMVIEVREEHPWKLHSPMLVTVSGMVIEVSDEQPEKQPSANSVKEDDIDTASSSWQPWKHHVPTLVTDDGMLNFLIAVWQNAFCPNFVTVVGRLTDLSLVHQLKQ